MEYIWWCVLWAAYIVIANTNQIGQAPFIRWPPKDLIVSKGGSIRLDCYTMGYPYPNVTWYKDGIPINVKLKSYIHIFPNYTLLIKNPVHRTRRKDGGKYSCIATNSHGLFKSENATVIVPYISNVFERSPQDADEFQTKSHKFECIPPKGYPKPKVVEWLKNGQHLLPVEDDTVTKKIDDYMIQRDGKVRSLSFWTRLGSKGSYACVAENSEGRRTSPPANFIVKVIPPRTTIEALTEKYVDDTAQLHCKIEVPLPVPIRVWSKVGGSMPAKGRYVETDDGMLIISSVKESDQGTYNCLTKNKAGEMDVSGQLIVYKKPVYIIQPTSMKIPVGKTAKFECKAKYGKSIYVKYWFDNKWYTRATSSSNTNAVHVNENDELIIPNVQLSPSTKLVRCVIADTFDIFDGNHVSLTVLSTDLDPPKISLTPKKQTVVEGDRLTLSCTATGVGNLQFTWYSASNGVLLTDKVTGIRLKKFQGGSNLTFTSVMLSDGLAYRCLVEGDGGTQSDISIIDVKASAGKAPDKVPFLSVRDVKSTSVKLVWGAPRTKSRSPITAYVIGIRNLYEGSELKTIQVGRSPLKKRITGLKPSRVYVFSVQAVNKYGKGIPKDSSNTETYPTEPITIAPVSGAKLDKLLDVVLKITAVPVSVDKIQVKWDGVDQSRITGYAVFSRKVGALNFEKNEIKDPGSSLYIIDNLMWPNKYEIKMNAFNDKYESPESSIVISNTLKPAKIRAPTKVGIKKKDDKNLIVTWSPPPGYKDLVGVSGYQISCVDHNKTPFANIPVNKQASVFILSGLDKWVKYSLTISVKTKYGMGDSSRKVEFVLGDMEVGETKGENSEQPISTGKKGSLDSNILDVIKEPWFIATIGTLVWLFLFVIVVLLCCRRARKRRQQRRFNDSARGLMGNRTMDGVDGSLMHPRWDNTMNTTTNTTTYQITPPKHKKGGCCRRRADSMDEDFPNRADIKPMMTYTRHESVEQRPKGPAGDLNLMKESMMLKENNMAIAMKNGYMVDTPLNNELSLSHRPYDSGDEYSRMKGRNGMSQELTTSVHSDTGSRRDPMRGKSDSAERRHAEIVRTAANKSFPDAGPVNVMETNPQASWKREKMPKESPKLTPKPPGENTLRRQAKSQFKPLPQLEVLNWHDGLPNSTEQSTNEGSQVSAPSSPKLSSAASMFSEGSQRPESRMSHTGSASSLNKYPFEKRRRKTSNASSMLSSELYQSEMDPSAYSDILSDRKKKKDKVIPPPIDLDGLTSDILLQWAESVTNSSPSSSGSSSPSRLSGISSEGSIYTDEDFAQAVAAVAECGGFNMDYDYSLPGMPGTQPPFPSTRNAKMNKIDEVLHQRSKARNNAIAGTPKSHDPHAMNGTPNTFIPQISMSSYLTGAGKGTPSSYSGQSGHHRGSHRKRSNPTDKNLTRYGTGFQDVDSASSVQIKPLTVSSLLEHDSSLGRDKKDAATKPLTVSNLRQHDTSLDRALKQKQNERQLVREPPLYTPESHSNKPNNNLLMPEAPLSVTSALERNESINSNSRDSAHSSSRQDSEVENGGTSERVGSTKKHLPHLINNPHC